FFELVLPSVEHSEAVVDLRIIRRDFQCAAQEFLRVVEVTLPPINVSEIRKRDGIAWPQEQCLFKVTDSLVRLALLRGHHCQIVPRLWIVWTQLHSLLKVLPCAAQIVFSQIKRC